MKKLVLTSLLASFAMFAAPAPSNAPQSTTNKTVKKHHHKKGSSKTNSTTAKPEAK